MADYNTHRPHQALAMAIPAQRFHPAPPAWHLEDRSSPLGQ